MSKKSLLPANWESNKLLPYSPASLQNAKCLTAKDAFQIDRPTISKIKREYGMLAAIKGVAYILNQLFTVRFSKTQLTPELVDEFTNWLLVHYYFLKLQEIELALLDYRGDIYQVIDLEVLKDMIEIYDMRRAQAVEESRRISFPELKSGTEKPMPDWFKESMNKLLLKRQFQDKVDSKPKTLEELLLSQSFSDPQGVAKKMREYWAAEWQLIFDTAKAEGLQQQVEPKQIYVRKKESYFKLKLNRPINK